MSDKKDKIDSEQEQKELNQRLILMQLGKAVCDYTSALSPDPFESTKQPAEEILKEINRLTISIQTLTTNNPAFTNLKNLLGIKHNLIPPENILWVVSVVLYRQLFEFHMPECPSRISHLSSAVFSKDLIIGNMQARKTMADLLESGILVLKDSAVMVSCPINFWVTKGNLLMAPGLDQSVFQKHMQRKAAKPKKDTKETRDTVQTAKSNESTESKELPANANNANNTTKPLSSALELFTKLKTLVIGQDEACKVLATRGWLHLKRAEMLKAGKNVGTNECLLFIGESGCGKTYLAETYGKLCSFPFASFNSTDATAIGYVGLDLVEDGIKSLIRAAGDNPKDPITIEKARLGGIIFYDEFTKKMASPASNNSSGRDISGIAPQQEILKAMSGGKIIIGGKKEKETGMEFDTNGILFLFAGYVEGLDRIIAKLNRKKGSMGFSGFSNQENHSVGSLGKKETPRDAYLYDAMVDFGFIPEFVNRLTKIVQFRKLTVKDLEAIATSPSGCIASINRQLLPMGLSIKLSIQAISMMAGFCVETGMMARGLRMVVGSLVEDLVFSGAKGEIPFLSKDVKRVIEGMSVGK